MIFSKTLCTFATVVCQAIGILPLGGQTDKSVCPLVILISLYQTPFLSHKKALYSNILDFEATT